MTNCRPFVRILRYIIWDSPCVQLVIPFVVLCTLVSAICLLYVDKHRVLTDFVSYKCVDRYLIVLYHVILVLSDRYFWYVYVWH